MSSGGAGLGLATALWALAAPALAETVMMPPGSSPDAGYAGVWRVIAARPAPWTGRVRLTAGEAPLLEYAVDFADHQVKGPAPLACPAAAYTDGVTDPGAMFGGKLAGDAGGAPATALGISSTSTFRTICNGVAQDYYVNSDADLVTAVGDTVYTLERPTGMDPEQFKAGFSGPSFDCLRAEATGDRLICMDAHLAADDRALGRAYHALESAESAEAFATFRSAQRAWRAEVMKTCGADGPMPDTPGDRGPIIDCLTTAYGDRADMLGGLRVARSGPLVIEPRIRFRTRADPETEESDIYPSLRGGPQADAFNAFVFKALRLGAWRMDDTSLFRYDADFVADMKLHARRTYDVERLDGRLVSLRIETSDFVGGHGEEDDRRGLSWDLVRGRPLTPADVFRAGAPWRAAAAKAALKDLRRQIAADDMPTDLEPSAVGAALAEGRDWLWTKDHAIVMFTVFRGSGLPPGQYDITIPYSVLAPFLRPDAPLP